MTAEYIFQWYEKPAREPLKGMIGSYATLSYNKGECIDGKKIQGNLRKSGRDLRSNNLTGQTIN